MRSEEEIKERIRKLEKKIEIVKKEEHWNTARWENLEDRILELKWILDEADS